MKKRHSIQILLAVAAIFFAATACTQDELTDDTRLPEGQYPLQIAAVTLSVEGGEAQPWGAPQTRVSETENGMGSKWDGDEKIDVQIDGSTETATYTVQDDGTVSSNAPLYWSDRKTHTVTAWYSATDGTLDLSDQTNGLAYLLHGKGRGDYQTPVTLTFTHSLAKVRITPSDDALGEVQSLQLYTYTQCTYEKGEVVQGSQEDWIEMKKCEYAENGATITCWEANVVPDYEIIKLRANNTDERNLSTTIKPVAGSFYNIRLNKDKGFTIDKEGNYNVTTAEGLKAVADIANSDNLGINITLTADINLKDITWTPIGTDLTNSYSYKGTFDGGGHTISGLTVTGSNQYAGLFGCIGDGGTVKNVKLEKVQITSDYQYAYVGGVAGNNDGAIENCSVSGSVSGNSTYNSVGGVVGYQWGGSITGCSSSATVQGTGSVGGVVGQTNSSATLTACYSTENVTLESNNSNSTYAGGVVGYNGASTLTACYATSKVTGTGTGSGSIYVGGVTGSNDLGTLTACYHATGDVTGASRSTGGVVGRNYKDNSGSSIVTACYWNGTVTDDNGIGNDMVGNGEATKVADDWTDAVTQMNKALSGTGWLYVLGPDGLPVLEKNQ